MKYGWNIENELTFGELSRDFYYANLLVDSIMGENLPEVRSLLEAKNANPNTVVPELGVAPLHLLAGMENEDFSATVTLQAILRNGGDPNVRAEDGLTPVHVAAMWGRCKVLDILLANGGDPELIDYKMFLNAEEYAIREQQWKAYGVLSTYAVMGEGGETVGGNESVRNETDRSEHLMEKEVKNKHLLELKDTMDGQTERNETVRSSEFSKGKELKNKHILELKNTMDGQNKTIDSVDIANRSELPYAKEEFKNKYLLKVRDKATNFSVNSSIKGGENSYRYSTVKKKKKNSRSCQTDDETRSNRSDRSKSTIKFLNLDGTLNKMKRQCSARKEKKILMNNYVDGSLTDRSDRSRSTVKSMPFKASDAVKRRPSKKDKKGLKKHQMQDESMSNLSDLSRSRSPVRPVKIKDGTQNRMKRQTNLKRSDKIDKNVQTMSEINSDQSDWSQSTATIQSLKLNNGALNTIKRQRRKTNIYESPGTPNSIYQRNKMASKKEPKEKISKLSLYGDSVPESCDWIRKSISSIKLDENALNAIKSRRLSSKIYQTKGLGEDPLKEREKEPPIYEESEVHDWVDPRNYETFDESSLRKINVHRTRTATYKSEDVERPPIQHSGPKLPKRNKRVHHKKKEDSAMYLCGYSEQSLRTSGDPHQLYLPSGLSDINSSDFDERGIPNQRMLCKMSRIFLFMLKKRHIYQKIK